MRKQEIGLRHKEAREEVLKMSVADYAATMDVKEVTVYSWESGRTYVPQEILALLEQKHGIAAGWILTGDGSGRFYRSGRVNRPQLWRTSRLRFPTDWKSSRLSLIVSATEAGVSICPVAPNEPPVDVAGNRR